MKPLFDIKLMEELSEVIGKILDLHKSNPNHPDLPTLKARRDKIMKKLQGF